MSGPARRTDRREPPWVEPPANPVLHFARNTTGRDFVVGDVHGMFSALEDLLAKVAFDAERDRLFSVGDLIDRGPDSAAAVGWIERPWFHVCRGNHEQFVLDADDADQHALWVEYNGGEWWDEVDEVARARFRSVFAELPLAIEIDTEDGRVGIVHADVPARLAWERFTELLRAGHQDAMLFALWSRQRLQGIGSLPVPGDVSWVYCGHTPTRAVLRVENVCYIDTGAVFGLDGYADARLTMIELEPTGQREHSVATAARGTRGISAPGR